MGQRGPKPLPVEVKQQRGTYRPDREQRVVLGERVERIDPPGWMTTDQKEIWQWKVSILTEARLLQAVDAPAVEAMVLAVDGWRQCARVIAEEGVVIDNTITGGFTQRQAHPLVSAMRGFQMDYYKWCSKFGLTPSDRTALGIQNIKGRSMQQQILSRIGDAESSLKVVEG